MYKITQPAWGHYILEEYKLERETGPFVIQDDTKIEVGKVMLVGLNGLHESGAEVVPQFDVGDIIAYKPYTGKTVKLNNKNYTAVAFADALCKLEEEE